MTSFAESSFLFALYFPNEDSVDTPEFVAGASEPIVLSSLVVFEFQQAVWFDVFRREHGSQNAIQRDAASAGLAAFEVNVDQGLFRIESTNLEELLKEAIELSTKYTLRHGIRTMDILHLAAAKLLGCSEFLTFDGVQRRVAELEGFTVPL